MTFNFFFKANLMNLNTTPEPPTSSAIKREPCLTSTYPALKPGEQCIFPQPGPQTNPSGQIVVPNMDILNTVIDQRITGIAESFTKGFLLNPGGGGVAQGQPLRPGRPSLTMQGEPMAGDSSSRISVNLNISNSGCSDNQTHPKSRDSRITAIENCEDPEKAMLDSMGL